MAPSVVIMILTQLIRVLRRHHALLALQEADLVRDVEKQIAPEPNPSDD
jgi:hypothetical protein